MLSAIRFCFAFLIILAAYSPKQILADWNLDFIPPATTISATCANGGNCTGTVTVTISCTDNETGCASMQYTIDGTTNTTTNSFYSQDISATGSHTITASSIDNAGNIGAAPSYAFTITAPVVILPPGPFSFTNITPACEGSSHVMNINWSPSANATMYYVSRAAWDSINSRWVWDFVGTSTTTSLTDRNLGASTPYYYYVSAYGANNPPSDSGLSSLVYTLNCKQPPVITSCTQSDPDATVIIGEGLTYTMSVNPGDYTNQIIYGWNGNGNTRASGFTPTTASNQPTMSGSYNTQGNKVMVASIWYSNNQRIDKDCSPVAVIPPPPIVDTISCIWDGFNITSFRITGNNFGVWSPGVTQVRDSTGRTASIGVTASWTDGWTNTAISGEFNPPLPDGTQILRVINANGSTTGTCLSKPPFIQTEGGDVHSNIKIKGNQQ